MAIYMKIDGIDGNVTTKGYEKWIEIADFSFNIGRTVRSSEPGNKTNREVSIPFFTEVGVEKFVDETSPNLFLDSCFGEGRHVQVHFCQAGGDKQVRSFLEFKIKDVLISSYQFIGGSDTPIERLRFNFTAIEQKYIPYDSKQGAKSPKVSAYDLETATTAGS